MSQLKFGGSPFHGTLFRDFENLHYSALDALIYLVISSYSFTSDAIKNAPDLLFDSLAAVYRSWLIHGTVSPTLLACAFLPLLKSSLKDPANTSSYRAIAGSSLLLKLFDKVVLILWGNLLSSDTLQFGYKVGTSTTQCSWLVSEVVKHFQQGGSNPIITLLDCSKAFDTCKFNILFKKLLDRKLPPIIVRVLIVVYEDQYAWVKWGKILCISHHQWN